MAAGGGALAASVALVALAALAAMLWRRRAVRGAGRVCVAVLGDLGRSPRMQHHALSLARHGRGVSLLGYFQTRPHGDVLSSGEIRVVPLSELRCSRGLSHASTHSRKQPAASCEDIWPSQKPLKVFESCNGCTGTTPTFDKPTVLAYQAQLQSLSLPAHTPAQWLSSTVSDSGQHPSATTTLTASRDES
ncbi:uncharacterized protein LOC128079068 isoform X8 [Tympanuchus pallidicinctus]|uniref:uncharacterized protein LOC128079068 isoform X8 n=1 Tax=Tympanuchus pallidicinctus TaxID=109042 RepID=UPI0022875983|nr:uncharacterized protein LOC128079068 isoform X8 [Tympanuchus pallidicinctus]